MADVGLGSRVVLFRLSGSLKARRGNHSFDRLSQNSGGRLELLCFFVDVILFDEGWPRERSSGRFLLGGRAMDGNSLLFQFEVRTWNIKHVCWKLVACSTNMLQACRLGR